MYEVSAKIERTSGMWARIAAAIGIFVAVTILIDHSATCAQILSPVCVATAKIVAQVLSWLGMHCNREMAILRHPNGFAYEVGFTCTGVIPAVLLATAILLAGGRLTARLSWAIFGAVSVLLFNMIRLLSLFCIGVLVPQLFGFAHSIVWQAASVSFLVAFFCIWRRKALALSNARV